MKKAITKNEVLLGTNSESRERAMRVQGAESKML